MEPARHAYDAALDALLAHVEQTTGRARAVDNQTREYRFDIDRLGARMVLATDWAQRREDLRKLAIGYFGASTALPKVSAPTLLIVGGHDEPVIEMNREAKARMTAPVQLEIVPGATHLFEEPGTLEEVQRLAGDWFTRYLRVEPPQQPNGLKTSALK